MRAHHIAIFITLSLLMARLIVPKGININQLSKYCSCLSKTLLLESLTLAVCNWAAVFHPLGPGVLTFESVAQQNL